MPSASSTRLGVRGQPLAGVGARRRDRRDRSPAGRGCARAGHERVAARRRVDVHEGDRPLVLGDDRGRELAGDDLAEEAVGVGGGHGGTLSTRRVVAVRVSFRGPLHRYAPWSMSGAVSTPTQEALHADVAALAALERLPCSPGEAQAAAWIAERLARLRRASRWSTRSCVHGTYYTPLGVLNALGAAGGVAVLAGRRGLGGVLGAAAAAGIWQDLTGGRRRALRRVLKRRNTTNVIAEIGARGRRHTLVVHAHHDAARTSFIFDQTVTKFMVEKLPGVMERTDRWPPLMGLVIGGPAAVAVSRADRWASHGGVRGRPRDRYRSADGEHDSPAGGAGRQRQPDRRRRAAGGRAAVAQAPPPEGLRVILLSAGAEECNQEGMLAFARRHFGRLSPESDVVLVPRHRRVARVGVDRGRGLLADVRVPVPAEGARRRRGA